MHRVRRLRKSTGRGIQRVVAAHHLDELPNLKEWKLALTRDQIFHSLGSKVKARFKNFPCSSRNDVYEYLERELKRGVGLEEAGVKLFREADGLADLAGEHEPLNVLPVADARQVLVYLLASAPVESLGGGAELKKFIISEQSIEIASFARSNLNPWCTR